MYIDGMDLNVGKTLMRQECCHFRSDSLWRLWWQPGDRCVRSSGSCHNLGRIVDVGKQGASARSPRGWQDSCRRRRSDWWTITLSADDWRFNTCRARLFTGVVTSMRRHCRVAQITGRCRRRTLIHRVHPVRIDCRRIHCCCSLTFKRRQHYVGVSY